MALAGVQPPPGFDPNNPVHQALYGAQQSLADPNTFHSVADTISSSSSPDEAVTKILSGAFQPKPSSSETSSPMQAMYPQGQQPMQSVPTMNDFFGKRQGPSSQPQAVPMQNMYPDGKLPAQVSPAAQGLQSFDQFRADPANAIQGPKAPEQPKHPVALSIFEGLQDVGANLMHGTPPQATQHRLARQQEQQENYDRFQEAKPGLIAQAYRNKIMPPLEAERLQAETKNLELNNPAMQKKQQLLASLQSDLEKGVIPPDQARQKYLDLAQSGNVPVNPAELDNIIQHTKAIGPSFQIQSDKNGRPEYLTDRQGNRVMPGDGGKFQDPTAQSMWDAAAGAHKQGIEEEVSKEQRMADIHEKSQDRANAFAIDRQDKMFAHQQEKTVEGQALKHLDAMNQVDTQFKEVQELAKNPNSANDKFLVMKALGVALPDGVKRINQTELNTIGSVGGLTQRALGELGSWTVGTTFTPQTRAEIVNAAKLIHDNKVQGEQKSLQTLQGVYGTANPRISQLAGQNAAEPTATGPNGHTIVFRGGKWVDKQTGAPLK